MSVFWFQSGVMLDSPLYDKDETLPPRVCTFSNVLSG